MYRLRNAEPDKVFLLGMRVGEFVRSLDWVLVAATVLLVGLGLAMLFSATYTQEGLFTSRFGRQCGWAVIATLAAFAMARVPYHALQRLVPAVYVLAVGGLLAVFFAAQIIRGAASRFDIAGLQLQPSEFAKIAVVLMLAWILSRAPMLTWRTVLASALMVGLPVSFILLEPDVGAAGSMLAVWGVALIFAGVSWRTGAGVLLAATAAVLLAWRYVLVEYQKTRIHVFFDPTSDPLGAGYNVVQAIVALGSGRWLGRGLGHGPQSQLQFLPEQHTDFIVASIGEELGFVGLTVLIVLYMVVLLRILAIARRTQDRFGQLIAVGTFSVFLMSFMVSAGMNMGLLPVTGIPLPLVSYGGSNLVSSFILLALVQSVHVYSKWIQAPPRELSTFT